MARRQTIPRPPFHQHATGLLRKAVRLRFVPCVAPACRSVRFGWRSGRRRRAAPDQSTDYQTTDSERTHGLRTFGDPDASSPQVHDFPARMAVQAAPEISVISPGRASPSREATIEFHFLPPARCRSCRIAIGTYPISRPEGGVTISAGSSDARVPVVGG